MNPTKIFSIFRLRGARGFDTLCTRSPPRGKPRRASRSLRDAKVQKERGPDTKPREGRRRGRGAIRERDGAVLCDGTFKPKVFFSESLILAQNERWQRGLGMQVERDPEGSNVLR